MKGKLSVFLGMALAFGTAQSLGLYGCGSVDSYFPCEADVDCRPDPAVDNGYRCHNGGCYPPCQTQKDCNLPEDLCIEGHCAPPDAGTPDCGTTSSDASNAVGCTNNCTPVPEGWSSAPAVWHGATSDAPQLAEIPLVFGGPYTAPIVTAYADLESPPLSCSACKCEESTGSCSDLPASISIRAAKCGEVGASIEFGGPTNWDGTCTNTYAMPADKKCPLGSSTLCAQSIAVSALGSPVEESCGASIEPRPILRLTATEPFWKTEAVGFKVPGCEDRNSCQPDIEGLPSGYQSCIYRHGELDCPPVWSGERFVVYEFTENTPIYIDDRDCSPCSCGAPVGSACTGRFRTFTDATCTSSNLLADVQIASFGDQCTNLLPPGPAVVGKEITDLKYVPGSCESSGGEPIGAATPNPDQVLTFCCKMSAS